MIPVAIVVPAARSMIPAAYIGQLDMHHNKG
jgi:hypothetical protein